jgi:MFS family permease
MIIALTTWLPAYFQRHEGMSIERSGLATGMIMLLAIAGGPLSGVLTDRWYKKNATARMRFPALSCTATSLLLLAALLSHGRVQFGFFLAVGLLVIMFSPGAIAVTQDVVHPGLRSTSLSINIVNQHLLGSAPGPLVVGALSDIYGLDKALLCLPAMLLLAGVLFFAGSFFYRGDVKSVEEVDLVFEA